MDSAVLQPVQSVILERAQTGSKPGRRTDGFKVGLAIEGGSMRGVVSAGMVTALEALGLRDSFDAVYGSSAGACAAAYFVAGQAAFGTRIYYEYANTRSFIDFLRPLLGKPLVDTAFIFDQVMRDLIPLDWEAVQRSGISLHVLASPVDAAPDEGGVLPLPACFAEFADLDDLLGALHASSRIPILAGAPLIYRDQRFWDGGVAEPIPIHAAVADGCTHILTLETMPPAARRDASLIEKLIVNTWMRAINPRLAELYLAGLERYRATLRLLTGQRRRGRLPVACAVQLDAVARRVGTLEKRRGILLTAAHAGASAVYLTFGLVGCR